MEKHIIILGGYGNAGITIARLVHPGNRYSLQGQFQ